MVWDGTRWKQDDTRNAAGLARLLCDEAATECEKASACERVGSAKTASAVLYLASVDRRLAATVAQWDADPWTLNTPDGVIDLRTSKLHAHRHDGYLTKVTAVGPRGDCPLFRRFLYRITGGDADLIV
jgi:putative DNA primase/helicase